jgi:hypothetical protein
MIGNNITIENARLMFRNFSGKPGKYNAEGIRNFCVLIDTETARALEEDKWNVRWLQPRDEGEEPQAYLQVTVSYKIDDLKPNVILISSHGKSVLNEDTVNIVDWAEAQTVDLTIRPYKWTIQKGTRNEKSGIKAYLKSMYVTIMEDELEKKYYDAPDSAADAIGGCGHCEVCDGGCQNHGD